MSDNKQPTKRKGVELDEAAGVLQEASLLLKKEKEAAFENAISVVCVRPWIEQEAEKLPEHCPIPRPALDYQLNVSNEGNTATTTGNGNNGNHGSGGDRLILLDPSKKFKPKKQFSCDKLFWFFEDGLPLGTPPSSGKSTTLKPSTLKDVYATVGHPLVHALLSGVNSMIILSGASNTGKEHQLFGPTGNVAHAAATSDRKAFEANQGFLQRFCFDLLEQLQTRQQEDVVCQLEVECVAIGEKDFMTDLLISKQQLVSKQSRRDGSDELKPKDEGDGTFSIQNATREKVEDAIAIEPLLKAAKLRYNKYCKSSGSHFLTTIRSYETHSFQDPASPTSTISKQRKSYVSFLMLGSPHSTFQRCIEVAVGRDSGETPQAVVPVRDSVLTKLITDAFGGNCNTAFLTCVSPFFEHVKDTQNYLQFASRVGYIKCHAKVNQDASMAELRKLKTEVKGLNLEVQKTSDSIRIVQQELDRREKQLAEKLMIEEQYGNAYNATEFEHQLQVDTAKVCQLRYKRMQKQSDGQTVMLEKEKSNIQKEILKLKAKNEEDPFFATFFILPSILYFFFPACSSFFSLPAPSFPPSLFFRENHQQIKNVFSKYPSSDRAVLKVLPF